MENQIKEIKEKMNQADVVLVGLGLDFEKGIEMNKELVFAPLYALGIRSRQDLERRITNQESVDWICKVLTNSYKKKLEVERYQQLEVLLKDKNYFIVSLNTSEYLLNSNLDRNRIVMPCGNEGLFQCQEGCCNEIIENSSYVFEFIERLPDILKDLENGESIKKYLPKGTQCDHEFTFNVREEVKNYVEEGYLSQWKEYMSWLARTLNKNLVILEFDTNFVLPGIIRWAFEKNAYINNKASLVRVNATLPQLTEEIKEKGYSLKMSGKEFLDVVNKY